MKPNEQIALDDFYQLHGRHLYAEEWNDNAIYFLNSKSPTLIGFDLSSDEMNVLMKQGEHLNNITPRSDNLIDYTTFGELSQLITDNWDLFDPIFQSKTAVSNVTNQLNLLRGPIAHCTSTDELEQERLNLAVKTWFKIMS